MLMLKIFFISIIFPFISCSTHGHLRRESHQGLAKRARGDVGIYKRNFDNARFTFYDVGLGACGQYSSPGDFIVALTATQFGGGFPGPECFKSITISYGGKTAQATIMDECMGCPYGGLDFSTGLFNYFASEGDGVIYGSWWFNDGSGQPATTSSSTWTPAPTPTSTSVDTPAQPTTTSSSTTPTTSATPTTSPTSTSSTVSTSTASSVDYNTSTTSGAAVPTNTSVVAASSGNLQVINEALVKLGALLVAQRGG